MYAARTDASPTLVDIGGTAPVGPRAASRHLAYRPRVHEAVGRGERVASFPLSGAPCV
jgi:hypothetical protein